MASEKKNDLISEIHACKASSVKECKVLNKLVGVLSFCSLMKKEILELQSEINEVKEEK